MFVLKPREKIIGISAGILLFSAFWLYFVIQPIRDYELDLDADLKAKNLKLYEAKQILGSTSASSSVKEFLKPFFSEALPQEEMLRLIKEIENFAAQEGLQVIETKPQPLLQQADWLELKVNITFEGSWGDVVKFLYQLEQSVKPLLVSEMSLEASLPQSTTIRGRLEIGRLLIINSKDF